MPFTSPFLDPQGQGYNSGGPGYYAGYGGDRAQAVKDANAQLMGRAGPSMDTISNDHSGINLQRNQQLQALGLMRQSAMGQGPSVAQAQTYGAMGQNIAAMNAAAQGRGGPAVAMNAGNAALNGTAMQGGMARSNEQAGLMKQYGQMAGGLNSQDVGMYGQDLQQLGRAQGLATQQGILNSQTALGLNQQEEQNELARQAYHTQLSQLYQQRQNQQNQMSNNEGMAVGSMFVGAAAKSDRRAKVGIMSGY